MARVPTAGGLRIDKAGRFERDPARWCPHAPLPFCEVTVDEEIHGERGYFLALRETDEEVLKKLSKVARVSPEEALARLVGAALGSVAPNGHEKPGGWKTDPVYGTYKTKGGRP